jgi:hypothetical protein
MELLYIDGMEADWTSKKVSDMLEMKCLKYNGIWGKCMAIHYNTEINMIKYMIFSTM